MTDKSERFCADYRADEGILRVTLKGEIDHHSAVSVRTDIDALIYNLRPRRLELILSEIGFMDSSGLGLVMGRYTLMRELGGELAVVDPSPAIMRIFKLAGMERLIQIIQTQNNKNGNGGRRSRQNKAG